MQEGKTKFSASPAVNMGGIRRTNVRDLIVKAKEAEKKEKKQTLVIALATVTAVAATVLFASL